MIIPEFIRNIYNRYYTGQKTLLATVLIHSEQVARKALECAGRKFPLSNPEFIYTASMLHDIGVIKCNAPAIGCHGDKPYLCHGVEGRLILEAEGMPDHALVCERHTGAGLTKDEIENSGLPLPVRDMLPLTIEEKVICYADSFFSKSGDLTREKTIEEVKNDMLRHGEEVYKRFMDLHSLFS